MSEIVIRADDVGKKFSRSLKRSMYYGAKDMVMGAIGFTPECSQLREGEFWAVDDVSFEIKKGETLGIIGVNGSGKTTLLRMLNGIFMPDKGQIEIKGRVGALIQVGAGFHPLLTGRENIYVNGTILGMSKKEIDKKFDSIVDFADIGEFLDSPVKYYSSGMYVRLGFAIAVHCEPEILLIDEILAVGDANFRRKCAKRMKELEETDVTIVFVTHDLGYLRHICDKAICLRKGKVVHCGNLDGAISSYMTDAKKHINVQSKDESKFLKNVLIKDAHGEETDTLDTGGKYTFEIYYQVSESIESPKFGFSILDSNGNTQVGINTKNSNFKIQKIEGRGTVSLQIPFLNLIPGHYHIIAGLYDSSMGMIDSLHNAALFKVHSKNYSTGSIFTQHKWEIIHP